MSRFFCFSAGGLLLLLQACAANLPDGSDVAASEQESVPKLTLNLPGQVDAACLPACLPCLASCLPACMLTCLPACLPACLSARVMACLPACMSAFRTLACLPIWLPAGLLFFLDQVFSRGEKLGELPLGSDKFFVRPAYPTTR